MALEKQASSGISLKQKAIMGVVVVIFLVVIWQVVGMLGLGGGGSATPTPSPKPMASQGNNNSAMTAAGPVMHAPTAGNNGTQAAQQAELRQAQVAADPQFIQQQQESEQKYIGKINDLEDLKIQRAIAETNQAIATAKLATVTAEKNISDLLTKPAASEASAANYTNKSANPAGQGAENGGMVQAPVAQVQYTVISVSMQLGKWSAVISYQGKLFNVVVGDVLAPDNSVVSSINKNGVLLRKDGQSRKISIVSSI